MKKIVLLMLAAVCIFLMAFVTYADTDDDSYYDDDITGNFAFIQNAYWSGKTAKWTTIGKATKYQVRLYRDGSYSTVATYTVQSKTSCNFSSDIVKSDDYWFEVRCYCSGKWSTWVKSDSKYQKGSGSGSSDSPSSITNGWVPSPNGWQFYENGNPARNKWIFYGNYWYWFDTNGTMLTGWQWINRQCYYLNPAQNGPIPYGACWMNGITPDGYTVNASGEWTVNGVVQVK